MMEHIMTAKMCKLAFSCYSNWIPARNWLLHSSVTENLNLIISLEETNNNTNFTA
jgi:hypothetical protein